jgi:hypothetical protein
VLTPDTFASWTTARRARSVLYERLRQICPTIRDVRVTNGGVNLHVVVSIKPTSSARPGASCFAAFSTERIRQEVSHRL